MRENSLQTPLRPTPTRDQKEFSFLGLTTRIDRIASESQNNAAGRYSRIMRALSLSRKTGDNLSENEGQNLLDSGTRENEGEGAIARRTGEEDEQGVDAEGQSTTD